MPAIRDLLARRSDLSTFVVHLTRDGALPAQENLSAILESGVIEARTPFGCITRLLGETSKAERTALVTQRVVCFTETPLEHLHLLLKNVTDLSRDCRFAPYGIAITKRVARKLGVNPVWYTDITPSGRDWLMNSVNSLAESAVEEWRRRRKSGETNLSITEFPVAKLAPFIEQMGQGDGYRKEFWWEREWRRRGDFALPSRYIVIAPEGEHKEIRENLDLGAKRLSFIDARWGLEEIIGRLAGFGSDEVGPF